MLHQTLIVLHHALERVSQASVWEGSSSNRKAPAHRSWDAHWRVQEQQGRVEAVRIGPADCGQTPFHAAGRRMAYPDADPRPDLIGFVDGDMASC
ncbi:hypothetical protein SL103_07435 [Streptomyces lydicus]|uniref:Uncharacterized protein n=1 Tax=Streptomyces lydicus TaxID=47763 RepID=A0A1D7VH59_9ACTN|nr:hypothetical protein SL103_07435 [Streptomyces lydicus]